MAPPIRKEKLVKITILPATGSEEKTKTVSFLETSEIYKEILKLAKLIDEEKEAKQHINNL